MSRGIALLVLGPRHTRWGGGQPHASATSTPGKEPVPILQEAGWAPGPVWTGGKSRPHRDSIPDLPARSQSLYLLSYRAHPCCFVPEEIPPVPVAYDPDGLHSKPESGGERRNSSSRWELNPDHRNCYSLPYRLSWSGSSRAWNILQHCTNRMKSCQSSVCALRYTNLRSFKKWWKKIVLPESSVCVCVCVWGGGRCLI